MTDGVQGQGGLADGAANEARRKSIKNSSAAYINDRGANSGELNMLDLQELSKAAADLDHDTNHGGRAPTEPEIRAISAKTVLNPEGQISIPAFIDKSGHLIEAQVAKILNNDKHRGTTGPAPGRFKPAAVVPFIKYITGHAQGSRETNKEYQQKWTQPNQITYEDFDKFQNNGEITGTVAQNPASAAFYLLQVLDDKEAKTVDITSLVKGWNNIYDHMHASS